MVVSIQLLPGSGIHWNQRHIASWARQQCFDLCEGAALGLRHKCRDEGKAKEDEPQEFRLRTQGENPSFEIKWVEVIVGFPDLPSQVGWWSEMADHAQSDSWIRHSSFSGEMVSPGLLPSGSGMIWVVHGLPRMRNRAGHPKIPWCIIIFPIQFVVPPSTVAAMAAMARAIDAEEPAVTYKPT